MVRAPLPVVLALTAVGLAACAPTSLEAQVRALGLEPAALVRLADDRAVAARGGGGSARVIELRADGEGAWRTQEIAGSTFDAAPFSTHLLSLGGDTGDEWNSYFYGTAPADVSRVTLDGLGAVGGQVVDGAWVLALRERDLVPDDMHWTFVDAFGQTIRSGTGIGPPVE